MCQSKLLCRYSVEIFITLRGSSIELRRKRSRSKIYFFIKDNLDVFQFLFLEGYCKTADVISIPQHDLSEVDGRALMERRRATRFEVDWEIRIERNDELAGSLAEIGVLKNLSSSGALLSLSGALSTGTQFDVYIKLPLNDKKWMRYPARVVRIEFGPPGVEAAVTFDNARPDFGLSFAQM